MIFFPGSDAPRFTQRPGFGNRLRPPVRRHARWLGRRRQRGGSCGIEAQPQRALLQRDSLRVGASNELAAIGAADCQEEIDAGEARAAARNLLRVARRQRAEDSTIAIAGAAHPIVRTHPVTGRKPLYLGTRHNACVMGMEVAESGKLPDALRAQVPRGDLVRTQTSKIGDMLIRDNRASMHSARGLRPQCAAPAASLRGEGRAAGLIASRAVPEITRRDLAPHPES